ncbi:MAG: AAA family ATPase, partial [Panacibacter sp.]
MKELISQSNRSLVYKESVGNTIPVIWKVCSNLKNTAADLLNEFNITRQLNITGVRRPLEKGVYENKEAFSYKYFDGVPLKTLIADKGLSLKYFLHFSIMLTRVLKELHETGIYHFRINSNNILCNKESSTIEIIDFSLARTESLHHYVNFQDWGPELAYIAPEQTGRLNQVLDSRTDLYSLGIVFYEMLTGRLPFSNTDNAMLVHMHLVQIPVPVISVSSGTPSLISEIVEKLLGKNPDDRYQTAYGLEKDLQTCLEMYNAKGTIAPFKLARHDESQRVKLSGKIYGRSNEINSLLSGVERVIKGGSELYLLSGAAGTGKTAISEQLRKIVLEKDGIMLTGKFDQLNVNTPYIAMISALKELATMILSERNDLLAEWNSSLKKAITDNEELIFDLVPELKWIGGKQEPVADNTSQVRKKRANFNVVFQKILQEAASLKKLLILFIDDLQWADSASWESINTLLKDEGLTHFMLIGCYRSGETGKEEYLDNNIEEVRTLKPDLVELEINNLSRNDIKAIIEESFLTGEPEKLSDLIYTKTLGNPFFVHQLLNTAFKNKILFFSAAKNQWIWNKAKFEDVHITDNVAEFMAGKVKLLPLLTQEVLMYASCIGNQFDISILAEIINKSKTSLHEMLKLLRNENFVGLKEDGVYIFMHDRIRQTVYGMISEEKRSRIHYAIAVALSSATNGEHSISGLYEIAGHFNSGKKNIPEKDMFKVAGFLCKAGLEAKRAAAFEESYTYLSSAVSLLNNSDWEQYYDFVLSLYYDTTEVAFIAGKLEEAEQLLTVSTSKARTQGDRVKAHEIKLNHLSENHQFPETIEHLLQVLNEIG